MTWSILVVTVSSCTTRSLSPRRVPDARRQFTTPQQRRLAWFQVPSHGSLRKVSRNTRGVFTDSAQALMSTLTQPSAPIALATDQSSSQSYMSGVLCSRGTVPSVEVRLVRTSAANPAEFQGECQTIHSHSPSTHTHQLFSVVHFNCAHAPTVIMRVVDIGSRTRVPKSTRMLHKKIPHFFEDQFSHSGAGRRLCGVNRLPPAWCVCAAAGAESHSSAHGKMYFQAASLCASVDMSLAHIRVGPLPLLSGWRHLRFVWRKNRLQSRDPKRKVKPRASKRWLKAKRNTEEPQEMPSLMRELRHMGLSRFLARILQCLVNTKRVCHV